MNKTIKTIIWLIVIILIVWGVYSLVTKQSSPQMGEGPVKIGLIMPLTGAAADVGQSNKNAFELAVQEINAAGGINGSQIELIIEDNKGCDSATGVTAMQKLANIDNVSAVYSACSNVALAAHPVAEQSKVVHFSCASNPDVREAGDYMFRIVPSDEYAGTVAAQYVRDHFSAQKVAILHCNNDWCVGLKNAFKASFTTQGGEIVAEEQIATSASDVRTELTKIKDSNPDLVYFSGYPEETIAVFKRAKEIGLNIPFFGGDAWTDPSISEQSGDAANNKYFTIPSRNYSDEFESKVEGGITVCASEAYDVAYILADTIAKVGPDSEKIKNELYNLRNYAGESGIIGLDEKGDLIGAAFDIQMFKDGAVETYEKKVLIK